MPFYTVQHVAALSEGQQDALAEAITTIHSDKFTTPKVFVNVRFDDISQQVRYVGGKRRAANLIEANIRHGPSRTKADYEALIKQIEAAWQRIVPDSPMNRVVLNGSIVAGMEAGLMLPAAGGDVDWIADNWQTFNERADAGDEEMKEIVEDLSQRGLVPGERNAKRKLEEVQTAEQRAENARLAKQRFEEELGWGDAA